MLNKQERMGLEVAENAHGINLRFVNAPSGSGASRRSARELLGESGGREVNNISTPRKGGKTVGFMLSGERLVLISGLRLEMSEIRGSGGWTFRGSKLQLRVAVVREGQLRHRGRCLRRCT